MPLPLRSGTGTSPSSTRPTATPLRRDGKGAISKRSGRYKAAEKIAEKAHRLILLTATPHSGRTESLWGLLRLLDPDAYGDRCPDHVELSAQQYRKVAKEGMVDLKGEKLFKPRHPHTIGYELSGPELDLYDAVTEFVSKKLVEIRGENARGVAGFALTAMQRRLASSVRAIRMTLETAGCPLGSGCRRPYRLSSEAEELPGSHSSPTRTRPVTSTRTTSGALRKRRWRSGSPRPR